MEMMLNMEAICKYQLCLCQNKRKISCGTE